MDFLFEKTMRIKQTHKIVINTKQKELFFKLSIKQLLAFWKPFKYKIKYSFKQNYDINGKNVNLQKKGSEDVFGRCLRFLGKE